MYLFNEFKIILPIFLNFSLKNLFLKKSLRLKHLSSSTEDLIMLFQAEKSLIQDLKQIKSHLNNQSKTNEIILQYLNEIDYNM